MTTALKQRIVGAIFILSLGVILIPIILDRPEKDPDELIVRAIPETPGLPDVSQVSKIHYVFNDEATVAATEPQIPLEPDENDETPKPELPESPEPATPPDGHHLAEATDEPTPSTPSLQEPALPSVTKAPEKAKETLMQTAQEQWTIQLGAFSSEKNAKALVQKLSQGGFDPYLKAMAQDSLVRVYVSHGIPREEAQALAAKLDTELGLKGIVVRYF